MTSFLARLAIAVGPLSPTTSELAGYPGTRNVRCECCKPAPRLGFSDFLDDFAGLVLAARTTKGPPEGGLMMCYSAPTIFRILSNKPYLYKSKTWLTFRNVNDMLH